MTTAIGLSVANIDKLNKLDEVIDLLPVAAYLCEAPSGVIKRYNRRSAELWGREPECGNSIERFCGALKIYHSDGTLMSHHESPMAEVLHNGVSLHDQEVIIERPDGKHITALFNITALKSETGRVIGAFNIFQDVTERKHAEAALRQSEERLRQSQKMEAVGRLAGGVAHDFNNLLTGITGHSELLLRLLRQGDPLRNNIEEIKKASDRAAALTSQLLAFSRKQVLQPKVLNLNAVVADMYQMLQRLIGEDIELAAMLDPALGLVKTDPGQVEQLILNLVVNARDAMPRGGKLTVETINVELDADYSNRHLSVRSGRYVMLTVSDTGCGMDKETQSHIFEPFFTTKKQGEGTGLGLSTVYGIAKQSGGNVWVYSEVGRGTTFKVYLPQVDGAAEVVKANAVTAEVKRGSETILLVEDEEIVRGVAREIMQQYGYHVLVASNGGEALLICERYKDSIHMMLTDVVMPHICGPELVERLASIRPEMKVLYMSGYSENTIVRHGGIGDDVAFLQKPFSVDALAHKVREVLDTPQTELSHNLTTVEIKSGNFSRAI